MTKVFLLEALKTFTEDVVKDILLPVREQRDDDEELALRAAKVYLMRLIKSKDYDKAAPYIIHQIVTGRDDQSEGERVAGQTVIRSVFCVYNEDEQEGSLMLLNLMERVRIALLETVVLNGQYQLNLKDGLETIIYQDDSSPYYGGEMATTWNLPSVRRKVGL